MASASVQGEAKERQGVYIEPEIQRTQNYQWILPREGEHNLGETATMAGALQVSGYEHEIRENAGTV